MGSGQSVVRTTGAKRSPESEWLLAFPVDGLAVRQSAALFCVQLHGAGGFENGIAIIAAGLVALAAGF